MTLFEPEDFDVAKLAIPPLWLFVETSASPIEHARDPFDSFNASKPISDLCV